ncbi:MAG: glycosyltransferase [Flavobacteriales bacterium]|jgi:cellulose synthase/poly-beta-1,6-N-acetylglucosamine synthase-like glycosyltransferase|nr:glycosyltransferase [Flavobacteriales bacterium]
MIILAIISFSILTIYGLFFGTICWGLFKKKESSPNNELVPLSVIIPFRNEEDNLANIVQSFSLLNYNLNIVEFIFVDDHSSDNSLMVLRNALTPTKLIYKIIQQTPEQSGKKSALITGIENAKNEYIITADADTVYAKSWLDAFSKAFQNGAAFIIGPVINKKAYSFLQQLHNIEALLLSGVTIGSANLNKPLLCSGANLGYTQSLFHAIKPYANNMEIASGDDLFFLDQVVNTPHKVVTLNDKGALAFTQPNRNYSEILTQAIRWSSKNKKLSNKSNLWSSILIFFTNILLYIQLISLCYGNPSAWLFMGIKLLIDLSLLIILVVRYNQKYLILNAPFIYILYPIHLMIIFVSSFFVSVKWKGRMISANG